MTELIAIWGASFGVGIGLWFAAFALIYPFQIIKQGVEQI